MFRLFVDPPTIFLTVRMSSLRTRLFVGHLGSCQAVRMDRKIFETDLDCGCPVRVGVLRVLQPTYGDVPFDSNSKSPTPNGHVRIGHARNAQKANIVCELHAQTLMHERSVALGLDCVCLLVHDRNDNSHKIVRWHIAVDCVLSLIHGHHENCHVTLRLPLGLHCFWLLVHEDDAKNHGVDRWLLVFDCVCSLIRDRNENCHGIAARFLASIAFVP